MGTAICLGMSNLIVTISSTAELLNVQVSATVLPTLDVRKPQLILCTDRKKDVCYDAPRVVNGKTQIILPIKDLNTTKISYIIIDDELLPCEISSFMPDVIVCAGTMIANGVHGVSLYSYNVELLSSGDQHLFSSTFHPDKETQIPPNYLSIISIGHIVL